MSGSTSYILGTLRGRSRSARNTSKNDQPSSNVTEAVVLFPVQLLTSCQTSQLLLVQDQLGILQYLDPFLTIKWCPSLTLLSQWFGSVSSKRLGCTLSYLYGMFWRDGFISYIKAEHIAAHRRRLKTIGWFTVRYTVGIGREAVDDCFNIRVRQDLSKNGIHCM